MTLIKKQNATSAVGISKIILILARNIRVSDGTIHMCVEMTELLVPNNQKNNIHNTISIVLKMQYLSIVFAPYQ